MNTTKQPAHTKQKLSFESNPFKSSFDGLNRLFKLSQTPAVIILVLSFASFAFNMFPFPGDFDSSSSTTTTAASDPINGAILGILLSLVFVGVIVTIALSVFYYGVVNYVAWKTSKNESTDIGEALRATAKKFWTILGIQIIVGLKVLGGLILFIIPGIRAMLRYQMVLFPVFDEDLGAWQAVNRIKFLTQKSLMEVFGIMTVSQLLFPVAILIQMGGESVLYPQLKAIKDSGAEKPPTHWLNYLGFVLWAGLFVIIASFSLLILILMSNI